jgi:hypothetical protein
MLLRVIMVIVSTFYPGFDPAFEGHPCLENEIAKMVSKIGSTTQQVGRSAASHEA